MPADAAARVITDGPHVAVARPNKAAELVVDARPPTYTIEESERALTEMHRRSGPVVVAVSAKVDEAYAGFRAELNEAAGGQASKRVMLLSHNAQRCQLAVELSTLVNSRELGRYDQTDKAQLSLTVEKGLRGLVGLCAVATDLINKAYSAALEEGKAARGSATDQLFSAIGVRGQASPPLQTPGGEAKGAPDALPPPQSPPSPAFPFTEPK